MPDASDIVDIIAGEPGLKSDITLFRENRDNFDPKQKFKGDLGYKGEDLIDTPIKRPRNGKLTTDQKKKIRNQYVCTKVRADTASCSNWGDPKTALAHLLGV